MGSLQAGQLAMDSLTVDNLKHRLAELERRLSDVSGEHREKQSLLNQHETEVNNIKKNSSQDIAISSRLERFLHGSARHWNRCDHIETILLSYRFVFLLHYEITLR